MQNNSKVIFVGRFCPFHKAHESVINFYRTKPLVIVIGSAQAGKTAPFDGKTMFNSEERKDMASLALEKPKNDFEFVCLPDFGNDLLWAQALVKNCGLPASKMLVTSLNEWTLRCCKSFGIKTASHPEYLIQMGKDKILLSATQIRRRIIANETWEDLASPRVVDYLKNKVLFDGLTGIQRIQKYSGN